MLIASVFLGTQAQVATAGFEERLVDAPQVAINAEGSVRIAWRGRELDIPSFESLGEGC